MKAVIQKHGLSLVYKLMPRHHGIAGRQLTILLLTIITCFHHVKWITEDHSHYRSERKVKTFHTLWTPFLEKNIYYFYCKDII